MNTAKKVLFWIAVLLVAGYACDEDKNAGSRAVAAVFLLYVYCYFEFKKIKEMIASRNSASDERVIVAK